jgi:hypothetical protein
MQKPETCINQTLIIYSAVVIVEIFIIARLMMFPWLILSALFMYWPIKAAMNWQLTTDEDETSNTEEKEPQSVKESN